MSGRTDLGPGDQAWETLAKVTLDLYAAGFRSEVPADVRAADKALAVWDLLSELELAIPPQWVIAVWRTQDAERGAPTPVGD